MITEDKLITSLAKGILSGDMSKLELSVILGISRTTLDLRLKDHKWKPLEKKEIKNRY